MWTLEHCLQFISFAIFVRMAPSLLSSASSALLPVLSVQAHGGNTTFPLFKGQSQFLSLLVMGSEVCPLKANNSANTTLSSATAATDHCCSWLQPRGQAPHQPIPCFRDKSQILLEPMKGKSPLFYIYRPPAKQGLSSRLKIRDFIE